MKVINKPPACQTDQWRRILHEIEILKHIKSPHCVRLFDAFLLRFIGVSLGPSDVFDNLSLCPCG